MGSVDHPAIRHTIVVDLETSGLDPDTDTTVEVAWRNLDTDEHDTFIPTHNPADVLAHGNQKSLHINRYRERIADTPQDTTGAALRAFARQLHGNTFAGAVPSFDIPFVRHLFRDGIEHGLIDTPPVWHHRPADLCAHTAGALGMPPDVVPSLFTVCALLEVPFDPHRAHTATADVDMTAACFRRLRELATKQLTTEQKTMWADATDRHRRRTDSPHLNSPTPRWWHNGDAQP